MVISILVREAGFQNFKKAETGLKLLGLAGKKGAKGLKQTKEELREAQVALRRMAGAAAFAAAALGALVLVKVAQWARESVQAFITFEEAIRRAAAVTEGGRAALERLEAVARSTALTTVFTAEEVANALFALGQAGFKVEDTIDQVIHVLNLAQVGLISVARAAEISTDVLAGMGLEISDLGRVVDVMTRIAEDSNQTINQLGTAFSRAGPFANLLGFELEEVAAALGVLANAGIKGTEGGTALRNIFIRLLSPTEDAGRLLAALGLSVEEVSSGTLTIVDIMERLKIAVDSGALSVADLADIFQVRAVNAVAKFVDNLDNAEEGLIGFQAAADGAKGTAQEFVDFVNEGATFSFKQFSILINDMKVSIGEFLAPAFERLFEVIRDNKDLFVGIGVAIGVIVVVIIQLVTWLLLVAEGFKNLIQHTVIIPLLLSALAGGLSFIRDQLRGMAPILKVVGAVIAIAFIVPILSALKVALIWVVAIAAISFVLNKLGAGLKWVGGKLKSLAEPFNTTDTDALNVL